MLTPVLYLAKHITTKGSMKTRLRRIEPFFERCVATILGIKVSVHRDSYTLACARISKLDPSMCRQGGRSNKRLYLP